MPTARANIRHSQVPCQINIKPHTRGLFILAPIIQYIISGFQQKKLQGVIKSKKRMQSDEIMQTSETDSDMIATLGLLNWEFKIPIINMLRALLGKNGHLRTDV